MKLAPKVMALALTIFCATPAFAHPGYWNGGYGGYGAWNGWNPGYGGCHHDNGRHLGWYKNGRYGYGYAPWLSGSCFRGYTNWGGRGHRHHHWD